MTYSDMTIIELKKEFTALWEAVNVLECYSVRDLYDLDGVSAELERRGYTLMPGKPIIPAPTKQP
jgi:hypothetical protein